ncbi:MAG: phosphoribosylaminoimidazolesuccinocarboxamide synthase [Actinomycetota bacterium]|nr:phosphoribosylaminoimidazolesuccinocarboxamide synthase [Actinomycetota bacterium]
MPLDGLIPLRSGKVRDLYVTGDGHLLLVASDRISTFDCVHPTPIPDKGKVLTGLSDFWFELTRDVVDNHLVATSVADFPPAAQTHADALRGRTMLVRRADVVPFECVARGYLTGSGLKEYVASGRVCGIPLPQGLGEAFELPQPIFTPATKAVTGHDENVPFEVLSDALGAALAQELRDLTLTLYRFGREFALERGIILADTKFEFGLIDGDLVLIDEVLTPDSSRYWPVEDYAPGRPQPSFDKQFVRDFAASTGWDRTPPAPELPDEIVRQTRSRYVEAYERLTGCPFGSWLARF